ncbi:hypothetical protein FHS61_003143 [Altererythrobacter atlanticus]|uniref:DUF4168 domain-containing protein n=1 Tax=Croceibacterium atlanticum TaxID=1267766 RepID=A0A0F7KTQ4_9SPHN|nr:DUF4168 domain-containing protein [Croceibacterium atlanticum]AKH42949.1 hypothetical protein WYH_01914 [Croceibacterium atlanticum]MBB5734094.1 hypothetical protein [Croceibacterium atlanticum]
MKIAVFTVACALMAGGAAFAQDAPAPAPAAPAPGATDFTDQQIDGFAEAVVQIQDVAADTTLEQADKKSRMAAIVDEAGLDPQTFNAISKAVQSDTELQQKVQMAIAQQQGQTSNQ